MINGISVSKTQYDKLLSKFPEQFRDRLRVYTGEELFYVYKTCTYAPTKDKSGIYKGSDVLLMAIKAKLFRYLKGQEKYPVQGWHKLGFRFKRGFHEFILQELEQVMPMPIESFDSKAA